MRWSDDVTHQKYNLLVRSARTKVDKSQAKYTLHITNLTKLDSSHILHTWMLEFKNSIVPVKRMLKRCDDEDQENYCRFVAAQLFGCNGFPGAGCRDREF